MWLQREDDILTYAEATARGELVRENERLREAGEVKPYFVPTRQERLHAQRLILLARALRRQLDQ